MHAQLVCCTNRLMYFHLFVPVFYVLEMQLYFG